MPDLDVSFMVSDPMLADVFNIVRRFDTVSSKGRSVPQQAQRLDNQYGVVTQKEPDALERAPDGQRAARKITVCTATPVYGPGNDPITALGDVVTVGAQPLGLKYQPDLIEWNGTTYLVTQVLCYSRFGDGTYEVEAESMTMVDNVQ